MGKLFKIRNGTPVSGSSLCHTCLHGQITRGREFQEMIICHKAWSHPRVINFNVAECSMHMDTSKPTLQEMKEIAWEVQSRHRGPVGFAGSEVEIAITPPDPNKNNGQPSQR